MLIGIAFSASVCGHKNLRWPGKMTLEKQFDVPVAVSISMCCWSQLFVPGLCGCLQEQGSEAAQGRSVWPAHPCSGHPAPFTLHFLSFRQDQLPLFPPCLCCGTAVGAVVQIGNVELSFPSCMGANVEFSFNVCPNFSNSCSCTDTAPACQVPAKNRLQLGVWSMLNIQGWSVF